MINSICAIVLLSSCQHNKPEYDRVLRDNEITCYGSETAPNGAIYFHGMDSISPSEQELNNRSILKELAEKHKLKIAIPRATSQCPNNKNQICWGWSFNDNEILNISSVIQSSKYSCKLKNTKILIGFSNGAYALNKLYRNCKTNQDQLIISIGANILKNKLELEPENLSNCGQLVFISGKHDKYNYDPSNRYPTEIKKKSGNVKLIEFNGGHEMTYETLNNVILGTF